MARKNKSTESTVSSDSNVSTMEATQNALPAVHDAQGATTAPAEKKSRQGALGFFVVEFGVAENGDATVGDDGFAHARFVTEQRFADQVEAQKWLKRNGGVLLGRTVHIIRLSATMALRAPERVVSNVIIAKQ